MMALRVPAEKTQPSGAGSLASLGHPRAFSLNCAFSAAIIFYAEYWWDGIGRSIFSRFPRSHDSRGNAYQPQDCATLNRVHQAKRRCTENA